MRWKARPGARTKQPRTIHKSEAAKPRICRVRSPDGSGPWVRSPPIPPRVRSPHGSGPPMGPVPPRVRLVPLTNEFHFVLWQTDLTTCLSKTVRAPFIDTRKGCPELEVSDVPGLAQSADPACHLLRIKIDIAEMQPDVHDVHKKIVCLCEPLCKGRTQHSLSLVASCPPDEVKARLQANLDHRTTQTKVIRHNGGPRRAGKRTRSPGAGEQ